MNAEIIAIGDEITSGQLLDTNTQWLSQRLEELGIRVLYHSTVGDELEPEADVFRRAIDRADVVIATGGLGPTADDLTRDALALATGCKLQRNDEAWAFIQDLFARRKRPMPPQNELQAMFPIGSRVIHNPHGTAPGIDMEVPRDGRSPCRVFAFPGVPTELFEMWNGSVAQAIRDMSGRGRLIRRRKIHCFGVGESQLESMLPDLIRRGRQPTVGITASKATITLRMAAEGETEAECDAAIQSTEATIRECLGSLVFGEEDDELQHVVLRRLQQRNETLATVEWATAGMLADWLGHVENVPGVYLGGFVITDASTCQNLLAMNAELVERLMKKRTGLDPVSASAAGNGGPEAPVPLFQAESEIDAFVRAMAVGCRERLGADCGLAVGAISEANALTGSPPKVQVALATREGVQILPVSIGLHPALLHIYCAKHALNLLRLALPV